MGLEEIDLKKIPVLPQVFSSVIELDDNTDVSFRKLEKIIKSDQSVSTIILRAANSPLYARNNSIKTLQMAISILGFKMVRSLVLLAATKSIFGEGKYKKFREYVWRHSVVVAILARQICIRTQRRPLQEEAFIAGLLHDIGKVLLNAHNRKVFIDSISLSIDESIPFHEAEDRLFGFNHHQVGELAVKEWGLPENFSRIVSKHEDRLTKEPADPDEEVFAVTAYANQIAHCIGYGLKTASSENDAADFEKHLGISKEDHIYFFETFPKMLPEDEFFRFCSALV